MSPDQYRTAISRLGLTQAGAAHFLGIGLRTSQGYANGRPIPKAIQLLLILMIRWDIKPSELGAFPNLDYPVRDQPSPADR